VAKRALYLFLYRSNEPIATTRHCLDDPLPTALVPNSFTQHHETLAQRLLAYTLLRPEMSTEFYR
jgi:hypothetical protein